MLQLPKRLKAAVLHESEVIRAGLTAMLSARQDLELVPQVQRTESWQFDHSGIHVLVVSHGIALELLDSGSDSDVPRVIVVAPSFGDQAARTLIKSGARGLLMLSVNAEELHHAVHRVGSGRRHITPSVAAVMAEHVGSPGITTREVALLELLSRGMSNKEIARSLGISDGTVKTHTRSIFSKLGTNNRTQAVAVATRRGILVSSGTDIETNAWPGDERVMTEVCGWPAAPALTRGRQPLADASVFNRHIL
ncbi:DNA-binding response regulator [Caldimonas sp. KR1-144]|uniref:response regulator transcription factor n=1 Tax=Caldimonas sp. KR1-144 TaxID=3400911 RepID=UPI003C112EFC